jgi:RNA polymerase sigma factor (sigma-70 family)
MDTPLPPPLLSMTEQSQTIAATVARERTRLQGFIRRRVASSADAEDIFQDVWYEFARACSLPEPIEQVGAWLFRVARNRIIDRSRKKREEALADAADEDEDGYYLDQALPSLDSGPEAAYARSRLLDAIALALDELPAQERDVFIAHELDGQSFKTLALETGVNVNTLLGWKRRAVLHLRNRLQSTYDALS